MAYGTGRRRVRRLEEALRHAADTNDPRSAQAIAQAVDPTASDDMIKNALDEAAAHADAWLTLLTSMTVNRARQRVAYLEEKRVEAARPRLTIVKTCAPGAAR